jgi:hypothetical protein
MPALADLGVAVFAQRNCGKMSADCTNLEGLSGIRKNKPNFSVVPMRMGVNRTRRPTQLQETEMPARKAS